MIILAGVSVIVGITASIAGFGIGSVRTPFLAVDYGISIAVVGVAVTHFVGTLLRFFLLRKSINRHVLLAFGLASTGGGIIGAFLHNIVQSTLLTIMFGYLLLHIGISGLTGLSERDLVRH